MSPQQTHSIDSKGHNFSFGKMLFEKCNSTPPIPEQTKACSLSCLGTSRAVRRCFRGRNPLVGTTLTKFIGSHPLKFISFYEKSVTLVLQICAATSLKLPRFDGGRPRPLVTESSGKYHIQCNLDRIIDAFRIHPISLTNLTRF